MKNAEETTIDRFGRLVVPKSVRQRAGITPGMVLTVTCRRGVIEIAPAPRPVRTVKKGGLTVAVPDERSKPLDETTVRDVKESVRTERRDTGLR